MLLPVVFHFFVSSDPSLFLLFEARDSSFGFSPLSVVFTRFFLPFLCFPPVPGLSFHALRKNAHTAFAEMHTETMRGGSNMKTSTMLAGVVTMAAIGIAAGMMAPGQTTRKMRKKVNTAMRAVGEMADSLTDLISDAF